MKETHFNGNFNIIYSKYSRKIKRNIFNPTCVETSNVKRENKNMSETEMIKNWRV